MWFEIFKFELQYRKSRPATYLYFAIILVVSFLAFTTDAVQVVGSSPLIKINSPFVITILMLLMSAFFMLITSAIAGVAVLRDFEHQTESLMFINPIKKSDYLMGRFFGSFVVVLFVFSAMPLAFIIGDMIPWPWRDADKLLPFNLTSYLWPFFAIVVPNLLFTSALFFVSGSLSRKMIVVFTQGVILLVAYIIGANLAEELDNKFIGGLLDPFALTAYGNLVEYWTPAERNSIQAPIEGVLLYNRILWIGMSILMMVLCHYFFSFNVVRNSLFNKKATAKAKPETQVVVKDIPKVIPQITTGLYIKQVIKLSRFYFNTVFKEIPFIAIVIIGLVMLFANAIDMGSMYGTSTYPTTYSVIELITSFNLFFLIIIVLYTGELVWKERAVKINLIYDSFPMPDVVPLISKFFGMVMVMLVLLFVLICGGVLIQTFKGYFDYELGVYFSSLYTSTLSFLILFLLLGFFVQVMVNHKFLGYTLMIVFFISTIILRQWGVEHSLFRFASGSLGAYSDMNTFGHFTTPFSWYKFYWFAFAIFLFVVSVIFSVRGSEAIMKTRLAVGKLRLTKPVISTAVVAFMMFGLSGCYIYYNTNMVNEYTNSDERNEQQASYEKALKKYEDLPQPKIVEVNLAVDIYPYQRDFVAKGYYYLKNKTSQPIADIHIQQSPDNELKVKQLTFENGAVIKESFEDFRYFIYQLNQPLQPGDSIKMDFEVAFTTEGFKEGATNTSVVFNGTFFNNTSFFPSIGYNDGFEIGDDDDRKENDLPEKERMMDRDNPIGLSQNLFGNDSDHIKFEVVVSTSPDQIAIAPGYLQKEWEENDRKYYHYKMDVPMVNFYNIVSARYQIMRDTWQNVNGEEVKLEIYYHEGHEYNLTRMMDAMKKSLQYYSANFSPYQYRQMRIMEFPRYASFAQSFANTVPFSEGIGFILNIKEDDVDMAYYVTAHEMAHQWWGHQVTEAGVKGNAMLSETLSQYSALMVMKEKYPEEMMQKFLEYEMNRYLMGRGLERKKELPIAEVESQQYIHYRKGSVLMYALQDYISEDSVNAALHRYLEKWKYAEGRYPTTNDLLPYFREVTPDSLQYIITDMFETITLVENKAEKAEFEALSNGKYKVILETKSQKFRSDSLGNESQIEMQDWVDIGVYAKGEKNKDKLIYLQKHKITQEQNTFEIMVDEKPVKAGIDPINKLIDRHVDDNVKTVSEKTAS